VNRSPQVFGLPPGPPSTAFTTTKEINDAKSSTSDNYDDDVK